jgi:hypothetical protein
MTQLPPASSGPACSRRTVEEHPKVALDALQVRTGNQKGARSGGPDWREDPWPMKT